MQFQLLWKWYFAKLNDLQNSKYVASELLEFAGSPDKNTQNWSVLINISYLLPLIRVYSSTSLVFLVMWAALKAPCCLVVLLVFKILVQQRFFVFPNLQINSCWAVVEWYSGFLMQLHQSPWDTGCPEWWWMLCLRRQPRSGWMGLSADEALGVPVR